MIKVVSEVKLVEFVVIVTYMPAINFQDEVVEEEYDQCTMLNLSKLLHLTT